MSSYVGTVAGCFTFRTEGVHSLHGGRLYCGRTCQVAHWKTHKKECKKILEEVD